MNRINLKNTRIIVSVFLLIVAVGSILPSANTWTDPMQITDDSGEPTPFWDVDPSVAEDASGKIWVVWAGDRVLAQYDVFRKTSTDGGLSWGGLSSLTSNESLDTSPEIFQASDGMLWLVWSSDRTDNNEIFYRTSPNLGGWWAAPQQLTNDPRSDTKPSITEDMAGRIWIVWQRKVASSRQVILCKTYNGISWDPETTLIQDPADTNMNPAVAKLDNGSISLVWVSNRTGNYDIFYSASADNGASWTEAFQLTIDPSVDKTPAIAQDIAGSIWVFWESDRPNGKQSDIYYKTSSNYGLSWSLITNLTASGTDEFNPAIVATSVGGVIVVWESVQTGDFEIFYRILYHDLLVKSLTPERTWVYENTTLDIPVEVENEGIKYEVTVNVNLYYDSLPIGNELVPGGLNPNTSTMIPFVWDPTNVQPGDYIILATVDSVSLEIDLGDNSLTYETVTVRKAGDANGDGTINLLDALKTMAAFAEFDPECDFNDDGAINLFDALILSGAFSS